MSGSSAAGTALVTGGCGFIGRHLTELLVRNGYSVRVVDLQGWPVAPKGVEIWQGSILDRQLMAEAVSGVDVVFHLAANPNLWAPDPRTFHEVNYEGTVRVLEASAKAAVPRIVYTSTESILKNVRAPSGSGAALIDESVELGLDDIWGAYCRSKFLAEGAARRAAKIKYPHAYASAEACDKDPAAFKFNCAQRAHMNTIEQLPMFYPLLFIGGLKFPKTAALSGLGYIAARFIFTNGYLKGPNHLQLGQRLSYVGLLTLLGCTAATVFDLVKVALA